MKMRLFIALLSVVLASASTTNLAATDDTYIETFPPNPVVGEKIGVLFSSNAEFSNFDDVIYRLTRVSMDAGIVRIDYYRTGEVAPPSS